MVVKGLFKTQAVIFLFSLAGAALVLVGTGFYGLGITRDSVGYLSAAENLSAGGVFSASLYPAVLALTGIEGARFLHALLFGLIVFFSGRLFQQNLNSSKLVILATATVLFSDPLLHVSVMAWPQCLYSCLIVLLLMYLPRLLNNPRKRLWLIIFSLPLLVWVFRDYLVSAALWKTFYQNLPDLSDILTGWFIPHQIPVNLRLLIIAAAMFLLANIILTDPGGRSRNRLKYFRVFGCLVSVYLLVACSLTDFYSSGSRYCAPVYVPVVLLLFMKMEQAFNIIKQKIKAKNRLVILFSVFWLFYPLVRTGYSVWSLSENGIGY
ncbi:MAG: hypothetical protein ACE5GM_05535, partial [bacterium]